MNSSKIFSQKKSSAIQFSQVSSKDKYALVYILFTHFSKILEDQGTLQPRHSALEDQDDDDDEEALLAEIRADAEKQNGERTGVVAGENELIENPRAAALKPDRESEERGRRSPSRDSEEEARRKEEKRKRKKEKKKSNNPEFSLTK